MLNMTKINTFLEKNFLFKIHTFAQIFSFLSYENSRIILKFGKFSLKLLKNMQKRRENV